MKTYIWPSVRFCAFVGEFSAANRQPAPRTVRPGASRATNAPRPAFFNLSVIRFALPNRAPGAVRGRFSAFSYVVGKLRRASRSLAYNFFWCFVPSRGVKSASDCAPWFDRARRFAVCVIVRVVLRRLTGGKRTRAVYGSLLVLRAPASNAAQRRAASKGNGETRQARFWCGAFLFAP